MNKLKLNYGDGIGNKIKITMQAYNNVKYLPLKLLCFHHLVPRADYSFNFILFIAIHEENNTT